MQKESDFTNQEKLLSAINIKYTVVVNNIVKSELF